MGHVLRTWRPRLAALVAAVILAVGLVGPLAQARPEAGGIFSQVTLQGRSNHAGIRIYADGGMAPAAFTDATGAFVVELSPGLHTLVARQPGYLSVRLDTIVREGYLGVPPIEMLGGDTNGDDHVNLFDLVRLGRGYLSSPPEPSGADVTGDGVVNLFDLVLLGANYNRQGPLAWINPIGTLTPSPTFTPIPVTATATPTVTPTHTPVPFIPNGLCVFIFGDANRDGRWTLGETGLAGRTFRIYDSTSVITPANALASYTFTGAETTPRCFPTSGLDSGTYRIQLDAPPAGGWGLIFSDPVAPVRLLGTPANVWEVEVDAGKGVFFSYSGGTPQPTATLAPLNLCGLVSLYLPAQPDQDGSITFFGEASRAIAPGTSIANSASLTAGASGCLTASLNGSGYIVAGAWTPATPTPTP